jgi:phage tail protein X
MDRIVKAADGMDVYVTIDGDMVDAIAFARYGRHGSNTEAIYEANPGLAARGAVLPAGVAVRLPAIPQQETPAPIRRLWD